MTELKILVVDDDAVSRVSLRGQIERLGFKDVDVADDGSQAIERIARSQYDVVFTDLSMGEVDGLEVLYAAHAANAATDVVLVTAHGSTATAIGALKDGATDYLEKPVKTKDLKALFDKLSSIRALVADPNAATEALGRRFADAVRELNARIARLTARVEETRKTLSDEEQKPSARVAAALKLLSSKEH